MNIHYLSYSGLQLLRIGDAFMGYFSLNEFVKRITLFQRQLVTKLPNSAVQQTRRDLFRVYLVFIGYQSLVQYFEFQSLKFG